MLKFVSFKADFLSRAHLFIAPSDYSMQWTIQIVQCD